MADSSAAALRSGLVTAKSGRLPVTGVIGRVATYTVLIVGAIVVLLPLFWLITTSLKPETEVLIFPPRVFPSRVMWANYAEAVGQFAFFTGLLNTMVIVTLTEIGRLLSASLTAFAFARLDFPLRRPLFVLVLSTLMVPYHVRLIPEYLVFRFLGWIDTPWPLIVPLWLGGGAFYVFLLRQFFLTIPLEMDDAARIDGCGTLGLYWRIILPLSLPALGAVAIFTFVQEWSDFLAPLIYLNSPEKLTLAVAMRSWAARSPAEGLAMPLQTHIMAVSLLITIPPLVIFFLAQRYFIQGVVVSGVKG